MYNLDYVVSDDQLLFDFSEAGEGHFIATDKMTDDEVGYVATYGDNFVPSSDDVFAQFKLWLAQPQRAIGKKVDIAGSTIDELADTYEQLLVGAYLESTDLSFAVVKPNCQRMLSWLRSTDFYVAPASSKYHDSVRGGLLIHSLKVYNQMLGLRSTPAFESTSLVEATIGALVHDWCKIGVYEEYFRNVKDEHTGQWTSLLSYRKNPQGLTLGHGTTSMYLASKCFNLSPELAAAIRFHMGEYNIAPNEMDELHNCNNQFPMCYLLQFADRLACADWMR